MQVVIERRGLHPEGLAAHQACCRVRDPRRVIAVRAVTQRADEARQSPAVAIAVRHRAAGWGGLRREKGITQAEMAKLLGVSQPIVSDYERGELRLHGELIVRLAEILGCSADELLGLRERKGTTGGGNRRMLRLLQQIELLPKRDQEALLRTIDAFLSKTRTA
ncbi:MAG: hypothetical protein HONDAALG_04164 [Gammaproteobacteria bacterium]|nr:hypothetical protein [Gammaproteobacteria bacterium]